MTSGDLLVRPALSRSDNKYKLMYNQLTWFEPQLRTIAQFTSFWPYFTQYDVTQRTKSYLPCVAIPVTFIDLPKSICSHWLWLLCRGHQAEAQPFRCLWCRRASLAVCRLFHSDEAFMARFLIRPLCKPSAWLQKRPVENEHKYFLIVSRTLYYECYVKTISSSLQFLTKVNSCIRQDQSSLLVEFVAGKSTASKNFNIIYYSIGIYFILTYIQCGGMIALLVDVQQFVAGFHVRFIASVCKVQGHIKEVHGLFVCFNCDLETMIFENIVDFLFLFSRFPLELLCILRGRHHDKVPLDL